MNRRVPVVRFLIDLGALIVPVALSCACLSSDGSPRSDSESHFLSACRADQDCAAGYSCICHLCTVACTDVAACAKITADATCLSVDATGFCDATNITSEFCAVPCDGDVCPSGLTCQLDQCVGPHACTSGSITLQPGPGEAKDIWTNSAFSHRGGDDPLQFVGGGLDDDKLEVGGFGDTYLSLIEFNLVGLPRSSPQVTLELFAFTTKGVGTTPLYLERIIEPWDWRTQGTGADRERLWWADRPATEKWSPDELPAPVVDEWYAIDVTDLFNAWQNGTHPNYGLELSPVLTDDHWSEFLSGDSPDVQHRPRLVVSCPDGAVPTGE